MNKKIMDKWFKDHVAKFSDLGNIKVLDFKNPSSNENRIRFIFEEDYYRLHITGDLGSLIATNRCNMTYEGFTDYINNPGYFAEKVDCHERPFCSFELETAKKDLRKFFVENDLVDECVERFCNYNDLKGAALNAAAMSEVIDDILEDFSYTSGIGQKGYGILTEIYPDAFEYLSDIGSRPTGILDVYLYAFSLAKEQLKQQEK